MNYTLHINQNFPFAQCPSLVEIEADKILTNDVFLPEQIEHTYNPNKIKMYVIGHIFGPICAVFAGSDQDALDIAVDSNMLDCCLSEDQDYDNQELTPLGNASELFDLSDIWLSTVDFDVSRDIKLIIALARSSSAGIDNLGDL